MPDKVIPPMPTEDGTYTNRFIVESTSERGGIESAHIYQLHDGIWRVCMWATGGILRGSQALVEVERANRVLGGLVKLVPEIPKIEDRSVYGVGTGQITLAEAEWRRITDELTRLRTQSAEWEEAPKTEVAVPEPPVKYEYGAKFFLDIGGGTQGSSSNNPDRMKKRYTMPVGAYPTIAALKEDYDIPNDAVILRRRKKTRPEDINNSWETA